MTGQIWRNREKTKWSEFWIALLVIFAVLFGIGGCSRYFFYKAPICLGWVTIPTVGSAGNGQEVLINKRVCTKWMDL